LIPAHLTHRYRLGQAFEAHRPEICAWHARPPAGNRGNQGGSQDLPGTRGGGQPRGLHDRHPVHIVVLEDHITERETDPDGDPALPGPPRGRIDGLLHCHRAGQGVGRRTEYREDPVAG